MAEYVKIKVSIEAPIGVITIDNPPANALSTPVVKELDMALDELVANPEVAAIVITGAGMFFIAGADIKEIKTIDSGELGARLAAEGQKVITKLETCPKPTIAAINGMCLGGGNELAMACHMRICSDRAKLGQPEVNLGLIPGFGGTQRLPRIVGKGKALEMILTGDMISAKTAMEIGLVNAVVPSGDVLKIAKALGKKIATKGMKSIALAIEAVNRGLETTMDEGQKIEAELFGKVCETHDMKEGVSAFLEKRKPEFTDKL